MADLTFYSARGTCALATHIALLEAKANFDFVLLDFTQQAQRSAGFLALNPKGRVPALHTPQGMLTETVALLSYLAQSFPEAQLAPTETFALAEMHAFNAYLASTMHVAHAHRPRASRWADDETAHKAMQAKVPQNMRDCCAYIEASYLQGPWVLGDDYSVADGYLFTMATWLESDGVSIHEFPILAEHHSRMLERSAVKQALTQLETTQPQAGV